MSNFILPSDQTLQKADAHITFMFQKQEFFKPYYIWADPGGGGSRGPRTPPGPQRGGPGPLFQNEENSIYYLHIYIYCVNYIKLHQESMKVCFCWRKNERIQ